MRASHPDRPARRRTRARDRRGEPRCLPPRAHARREQRSLRAKRAETGALLSRCRFAWRGRLYAMSSRRIAIVGSGQAALLAAHGLVKQGHEITLYSDRSADRWLNGSRPTGTAARFEPALAFERELGLAHWEGAAPPIQGVHLTFCPTPTNRLVRLIGRLPKEIPALAIDLRLQSHRWMNDLEAAGVRVIVEAVDVAKLDEIAAKHELTIVATGRGPLADVFPRDEARSVYTTAQRKLAMVIV